MRPSDARQAHRDKLLQLAQQELGIRKGVRLFDSAEGSFAPLTIADSKAAAEELNAKINQVASPSAERANPR
jgi:hypothetical protein